MFAVREDPWHRRIARARTLAAEHPAASDILTFYAGLAGYQRSLVPSGTVSSRTESSFSEALDLEAASRAVRPFLRWLLREAPAPLAAAAADAQSLEESTWLAMMRRHLIDHDVDVPLAFILEAVLQPFAEAVATGAAGTSRRTARDRGARATRCPVCDSHPAVGALREEGHGARRTLVCSLCFTEWEYLRVVCPSCDERRFDALPVYTAETLQQVRVDACDTCRGYLKTVDLTKDGLAAPIVDDLATLALDLWARESGYHRLYPNLLRL